MTVAGPTGGLPNWIELEVEEAKRQLQYHEEQARFYAARLRDLSRIYQLHITFPTPVDVIQQRGFSNE